MKTIKGAASLFPAQFAGDEARFNSWGSITTWAADCGDKGVQVPRWDGRLIDLHMAACRASASRPPTPSGQGDQAKRFADTFAVPTVQAASRRVRFVDGRASASRHREACVNV